MRTELLVGCSGWNYPDLSEKGGWVGSFYPDTKTRFLRFYSNYFRTAEMDSTFYEKFYTKMTKGTFIGIGKATPEDFRISLKVPETVTHVKQMKAEQAMQDFEGFLDKIAPLKNMKRLGVILFQLPPSFTAAHFKGVQGFLDRLPTDYQYAVEFRHSSWETEGALELLKQYNIAAVMTDSPDPSLQYLSNIAVTADHSFMRFHGRSKGYWYNYLYSEDELKPWVEKVNEVKKEVKVLHVYFNNHYAGKAVYNGLKFRQMAGETLSSDEKHMLERMKEYFEGKPVPGQKTLD